MLTATATIEVFSGAEKGKSFFLGQRSTTNIGRDARMELQIEKDAGVSRRHLKIRFDADSGNYFLSRFGDSTVTLNGKQACNGNHEPILRDGDMIQIGATRIKFKLQAIEIPKGSNALYQHGDTSLNAVPTIRKKPK